MKRVLFVAQALLFICINLLLFMAIITWLHKDEVSVKTGPGMPIYNGKEEYDPGLQRLTSVNMLEAYCDSLFKTYHHDSSRAGFEQDYPTLVSSVVRKKFYHGYSSYGFTDNYMALLLEPLTGKNASAIVIPDDIMKHPYAACSQQSLVMMELLRRKGFTTRKVAFVGADGYSGHFCFEVWYNGSWHYFDPNQEPDQEILATHNRPGIDFLARNQEILRAAYHNWDSAKISNILLNYSYGEPNRFEAPNALLYQRTTKVLSYTAWLILLLPFILVRRKYRKLVNQPAVNKKKTAVVRSLTEIPPIAKEQVR